MASDSRSPQTAQGLATTAAREARVSTEYLITAKTCGSYQGDRGINVTKTERKRKRSPPQEALANLSRCRIPFQRP